MAYIYISLVLLIASHLILLIPGSGGPPPTGSQQLICSSPGFNGLPASLLPSYIAEWYCPINSFIVAELNSYIYLISLVLIIPYLVSSVLISIGIAFKLDKVRRYGVAELYDAVASSIMLILFIYISAILFGDIPGIYVGPVDPYTYVIFNINNILQELESLYTNLYYSAYGPYTITSLTISLIPNLFNLLNPVANAILSTFYLGYLNSYVIPALALSSIIISATDLLTLELYLIEFFGIIAIPAFIIPGLLIRVFLPLRGVGASMVAIGFTLFLIVPTLFSIAVYLTSNTVSGSLENAIGLAQSLSGVNAVKYTGSSLALGVSVTFGIENALDQIFLLALFYPALIVVVAFSAIQQLTSILGGSAQVGQRFRAAFI
ncbi:MAG: hypothetical protein ARM1_0375 [Candidatus Micrarchaeota archaeon]|nr:MAG: hypothetical protein ARM1_0375 [Candidatus Micrarchaeota archaeon]